MPERLTELDARLGETTHRGPWVMSGGVGVLFVAQGNTYGDTRVVFQSFETGQRHVLVEGASGPGYASSGHLTYVRDRQVMAAVFDPSQPDSVGVGVPIDERPFAVSDTGTMLFVMDDAVRPPRELVWVDRSGREDSLGAPDRMYEHPRVSPDGGRVAVSLNTDGEQDIWLYGLDQQILTPLTFGGSYRWLTWTPNGSHVTFGSNQPNTNWDVAWKSADGSGDEELLVSAELGQTPHSWTPDGETLFFQQGDPQTGQDLWVLTRSDGMVRPWLQTEVTELEPAVAPSGQWVAYTSDESGDEEVYVRPLTGSGLWRVSSAGGSEPVWSRDGRELFYRSPDQLVAVDVATIDTFEAGAPRALFPDPYFRADVGAPAYDVSPDGARFLMIKSTEELSAPTHVGLVLNWHQELLERVPIP